MLPRCARVGYDYFILGKVGVTHCLVVLSLFFAEIVFFCKMNCYIDD